jgi:hypothetical protein
LSGASDSTAAPRRGSRPGDAHVDELLRQPPRTRRVTAQHRPRRARAQAGALQLQDADSIDQPVVVVVVDVLELDDPDPPQPRLPAPPRAGEVRVAAERAPGEVVRRGDCELLEDARAARAALRIGREADRADPGPHEAPVAVAHAGVDQRISADGVAVARSGVQAERARQLVGVVAEAPARLLRCGPRCRHRARQRGPARRLMRRARRRAIAGGRRVAEQHGTEQHERRPGAYDERRERASHGASLRNSSCALTVRAGAPIQLSCLNPDR